MSKNTVTNPGSQGRGFMIAVIAILLAIVAVIAYFVVSNRPQPRELKDVDFALTYADNTFELANPDAAKDAPTVDLFEDFSCSHCADLHEMDHDTMVDGLNDGKLKLRIHSLAFMDEARGGKPEELPSMPSHQSLAALIAVAQEKSPELFWNFRDMLFQDQADAFHGWKPEDYAKHAADLGASDETQQAIKDQKYVKDAEKVYKASSKTLEGHGLHVSSPHAFVGDKQVDLGKAGNDWVSKVIAGDKSILQDPKTSEDAK